MATESLTIEVRFAWWTRAVLALAIIAVRLLKLARVSISPASIGAASGRLAALVVKGVRPHLGRI